MKKYFVIGVLLILLVAPISVVNALTLDKKIEDEPKIELTEDFEIFAGKITVDPGNLFNLFSPDIDIDFSDDLKNFYTFDRNDKIIFEAKSKCKESFIVWDKEVALIGFYLYEENTPQVSIDSSWVMLNSGESCVLKANINLKKIIESKEYFIQTGAKIRFKIEIHCVYTREGDAWENRKITDIIEIQITGNHPPNKPNKPEGPKTVYPWDDSIEYASYTKDPDGDFIYYGWDINNDYIVDWWSGPRRNDEVCKYKPKWEKGYGDYTFRVMAKDDVFGEKSEWSDPLKVTYSKGRTVEKPILTENYFIKYIQNLFQIRQ